MDKNPILAATASILGLTATQLQEKLIDSETSEALSEEQVKETIFNLHRQKIETIKSKTAAQSVKDALASRQRKLAEKYGLNPSGTIEDVFERLSEKSQPNNDNSVEISPQEVIAHPEFQKLKSKFDSIKSKLTTTEESYKKEVAARKRDQVMQTVRGKIKETWMSKNPVLAKDEAIRSRQIKVFLQQFESENFDLAEDGSIKILDANGQEMIDSNYNPISLEHLVMSRNLFELGQANSNQPSPRYPSDSPNSPKNHNFTEDDLGKNYLDKMRQLKKDGDQEGYAALRKAYQEKHFGQSENSK